MNQETIARIMSIEQEAAKIHDDAQHQAEHLIAEAEKTASVLRKASLMQARQDAEQQLGAARAAAEAEYARILAQAETEVQTLEALTSSHFEDAVAFVLGQLSRQ